MKKFFISLCTVAVMCTALLSPCHAAQKAYHWYCVHAKGHIQPNVGADIAFVEELGGYYIDRAHADMSAEDKVVYLTFDAGYENGNVAKILDVLREKKVPAAFFVLGNLIKHDTELVRRMAEEGHLVCNHTVRHKDMSSFDEAAFLAELKELETMYQDAIGQTMPPYYRPPEGTFSRENLEVASKNGYKTVFWSFAYPDWDNAKQMAPERARQIVLDNVHNGEVMLLHPTSATNVAILGDVIDELQGQGFRFGMLDELTGQAS